MLAAIASCARVTLSLEQQRQAKVVERFYAALNARDWDAALRLCMAQLRYYPAANSLYAPARKLEGKDAYRAYAERSILAVTQEKPAASLRLIILPVRAQLSGQP